MQKIEFFQTPFSTIDVLVKTRIDGDLKDISNALLFCYDDSFAKRKDKNLILQNFRKVLKPELIKKNWEYDSTNIITKTIYNDNVIKRLTEINNYLEKNNPVETVHTKKFLNTKESFDLYQIIFNVLNFEELKTFLIDTMKSEKQNSISYTSEQILVDSKRYATNIFDKLNIDKIKKSKLVEKFLDMLKYILDEIEYSQKTVWNRSFNENNIFDLNGSWISCVSEQLNKNIYILENGIPLKITNVQDECKKSIIILKENKEYFPIGKFVSAEETVSYQFYTEDPIIKRLYTFAFKPELIYDLYPQLNSLLPPTYKKRDFNVKCSKSPARKFKTLIGF